MPNPINEQALLDYIRALTYTPQEAVLHVDELPEALRPLGTELTKLGDALRKSNDLAVGLATGAVTPDAITGDDAISAGLNELRRQHHQLAELMKQVAAGDYARKSEFSGEFSSAFNEMVDRLRAQKEELELSAYTDSLTGAGNQRAAGRVMDELWQEKRSFTVAMVDLDDLKTCNAAYGHAEGNRFLQAVYRILRDSIPGDEHIFRISGDMFLVISETMTIAAMEQILEDARTRLREAPNKGLAYRRSFSYGCAAADATSASSYNHFLADADEQMYHYRYVRRDPANGQPENMEDEDLNRNGLKSRAFDAFAATDPQRYLYMCNVRTNISRWSLNAVKDFDLPGEYMADAGNIWADRIHPDDRDAYLKDIHAVFSGHKQTHSITYRVRTKNGRYVVCTCKGYMLKDENGQPDYFAGSITNHGMIDNVDPVTSLYNVYRLIEKLRALKSERKPASLLVMSINQFRRINNSYGFEFGNKVLQRLALSIQERVGDQGSVFRLNSVKFCVLIERQADFEELDAIYRDVSDLARNHLKVDDRTIRLTLAGGSASFRRVDTEPNAVLAELEYALSVSKKEGQGALNHYDDARHSKARRQLELIDTLIRSVLLGDFHGFFLEYQPQVRFDGRVVGAEALVRWKDDTWGRIPPNDFIPILENDSCFYELGLWILQTALREVLPIVDAHPDFMISVNVSYRQLELPIFSDDVLAIVNRMGFPTRNLTIELTEHCRSIQQDVLTENLNSLRAAGIRISADDFGTGYSSLALLRDLPFDCIKIDRTFISDIVENSPDQIIVKSTIQCAKDFGIHVCVEGVEDVPSLMTVDAFQPDMYQGYLYSKPISLEALLAMFQDTEEPKIAIQFPELPLIAAAKE